MASFLRLNGIAVPVALGSNPQVTQDTIGKMRRSVNATAVAPRRARKQVWRFGTAIRAAAEALAFRELISGAGHVLSFDAQTYYTSKGMAPVSVAGGWSFTTSGPKYGAACAQWTTGNAVWAFFSSSSPWTVAWWINVSAAGWHHYVVTSAGNVWIDGVLTGGGPATPGFSGVSSGSATFGSATASKIDDVIGLAYIVPSDWPAQIYGFGAGFSALPALTADGDFIEGNTSKTVIGNDATGHLRRGTLVKNLHDFDFELAEQ